MYSVMKTDDQGLGVPLKTAGAVARQKRKWQMALDLACDKETTDGSNSPPDQEKS
jgi:hypothetical protein